MPTQVARNCYLRVDLLRPCDIILSKGVGLISKLIAALGESDYSHVALVVNGSVLVESDGHVRAKCLRVAHVIKEKKYMKIHGAYQLIAVLRCDALGAVDEGALKNAILSELGRPYPSYLKLIAPLLYKKGWPRLASVWAFVFGDRRPFCSEFVAQVLAQLGEENLQKIDPIGVKPGDLAGSKAFVEITDATEILLGNGEDSDTEAVRLHNGVAKEDVIMKVYALLRKARLRERIERVHIWRIVLVLLLGLAVALVVTKP